MQTSTRQPSPIYQLVQALVNFVIPIYVLTKLSSQSQLGPTRAMLVALAFPVAFELYSIYKKRKVSMLSVIAIGGILVTGAISLLGLSENWLAARRSIPYFAVSLAIVVSMLMRRSLVEWALKAVLDMEAIVKATNRLKNQVALRRLIRQTSYLLCILFFSIGVISLILTKTSINAQTDTALFNTQYAHLRIIGIFYTTLPLLAGFFGIFMYLLAMLEKLTGLSMEDLVKKKDA